MEYAPRGFDWLVQVFFLNLCCLPCAYGTGEGGFAWVLGAKGQTCTAACTSVSLVCLPEKFCKVDSTAAFQAASDGSLSCPDGYRGNSGRLAPAKYVGFIGSGCFWQTAGSGGTCASSSSAYTVLNRYNYNYSQYKVGRHTRSAHSDGRSSDLGSALASHRLTDLTTASAECTVVVSSGPTLAAELGAAGVSKDTTTGPMI